ncbi:PREDICTED: uncharacterized protein LOC109349445 [Lupinus angustifolius]|uniref:uncharacterized protein LOC109349445 n=1 Tax=Lupinus angustifolius TaxID=3871 RepID=UPI00092E7866|nr:PREDICTED: uncharacterized protein LOC109349445 [Lupinus angustifolius]
MKGHYCHSLTPRISFCPLSPFIPNLDFRSQFQMESRKLAALLSSLISQLLLLLLLIFPPNSTHPNSLPNNNSLPLIHHLLLSNQIAATLSAKRKRKRRHNLFDPDEPGSVLRSPDSFVNCYNMTSSTFEWLAGLLEPLLDCRDPAGLFPINLTAGTRLGIGLFRLANGSDYPDISTRFGVPVSVAKFCVKQLCRVLCTNFRFWVSFPNSNELELVSKSFESLSGLPNCCGAIESCRFEVFTDSTSSTRCLAAQIVVDSSGRILNTVAGFDGYKRNTMILKASTLYKDIEEGMLLNNSPWINENEVKLNQYLIGDKSYPLLPWLMVPFVDDETFPGSIEESFNKAHEVMHLPALKTAASLKNWGILRGPIHDEVKMAVAYIGACSILHNSLLMREDFTALAGAFEDYQLQQERYREDSCRFEDDLVSGKALGTRSTLATMARKNS